MDEVFVVGTACTAFGRAPDRSFKDLAHEVVADALADAALPAAEHPGTIWFANCLGSLWGQSMILGQVALQPSMQSGLLPGQVPVTNVESACASGSKAFLGAVRDVALGLADFSLALGVEKLVRPDGNEAAIAAMAEAYDRFDPASWQDEHSRRAAAAGCAYAPAAGHAVTMDTYAVMAREHMARYGTTVAQIAAAAAKNHNHGAANPRAQYRFTMTAEDVLTDRMVMPPLTRAMCAPIGDGAAAALVCTARGLGRLPPEARARAVRLRGFGEASGRFRTADEAAVTALAARRAYAMAGLAPGDVDIVELHDAAAVAEIIELENLGLFAAGEAAAAVAQGATGLHGRLPVNLSGGLVSKGHPVGATGLSMLFETCLQLRGEAGPRQAATAEIGLVENGGGILGMEAAACAVTLLQAPAGR
ncbi:MAG: thiolase family protein [Sneathiellaceae bacterium]